MRQERLDLLWVTICPWILPYSYQQESGSKTYGEGKREDLQPGSARLDIVQETSQDTGGELMSGEIVFSPHGGKPLHVYPNQEEQFQVFSGMLGVQLGTEALRRERRQPSRRARPIGSGTTPTRRFAS